MNTRSAPTHVGRHRPDRSNAQPDRSSALCDHLLCPSVIPLLEATGPVVSGETDGHSQFSNACRSPSATFDCPVALYVKSSIAQVSNSSGEVLAGLGQRNHDV